MDKRAVEVFVQPAFGLPTYDTTAMEKIRNHLEGFVAELLWNRLIRDRTVTADGRTLVHAEEVKADPTGTGADGLVVYEVTDGTLVFQLWEIKKHAATTHISATIKRAADQLAEHGPRYLAMLTAPGTKVKLITREPVGTLVLKADDPDQTEGRKKDTAKSDPNYVIAAKMIALIGHAGTALTVCPTRATTQRIALALANMLPRPPCRAQPRRLRPHPAWRRAPPHPHARLRRRIPPRRTPDRSPRSTRRRTPRRNTATPDLHLHPHRRRQPARPHRRHLRRDLRRHA
ncbi:hypothetical protein AB0L00_15375 [Actinoallomurus sp. NPDC052308]|uniref:hypothetical protein n=1 Tax=Actinoallomurus sp. NPDC052308 TaxID=3155530 RepID=UPI003440B87B